MNEIINEKTFPIQGKWIVKDIITAIPTFFIGVLIFFSYIVRLLDIKEANPSLIIEIYVFTTVGLLVLAFFSMILRWKNYQYSLEANFLRIKQGILSKQERHIPYGVIQNIFIKQDLFDRIIGLASLSIENASQGGGVAMNVDSRGKRYNVDTTIIGASGNKVSIPGLVKDDAENLKSAILQKMKENPIDNTQSGL